MAGLGPSLKKQKDMMTTAAPLQDRGQAGTSFLAQGYPTLSLRLKPAVDESKQIDPTQISKQIETNRVNAVKMFGYVATLQERWLRE